MRKKETKIPIIDIEKYGGRQVAVIGGEIVASGKDAQEVLRIAKRRHPRAGWRDILVIGVPKGLTVVYRQ